MTFDSVLSLAAFAFSSVSLVLLYVERRRNRRTDLTMRMYEIWTTEPMRSSRAKAWEALDEASNSDLTVKWSEADKDLRKDLSPVRHFAGDIETLSDAGLLNMRLLAALFGLTLRNHLQQMEDLVEYDHSNHLTVSVKRLNNILAELSS